ncbi:unnamed protein product (macronuclear) [Paramecium tetraurelia]|uniref:Uncharacterized protein n=1 Tax=Paramecium tetraurelia TaxID=5888 RepID=A0DNN2_PARTE|nr:uncharacterized protein GSPATT00018845001 [Paramecium tetraurelia]CAK84649.1 unnamed protein product [Paramecium tetraurelia]|eukprot:XP_001452046.1 hypothetical protein (macronuclear) [Paramecium tetraurelia strain d4-2]
MNQNSGQYFKLSKLTNIMMECGQIDYYLRKHENRIGIIHEGQEYIFLEYLEDNELLFDSSFERIQDEEENEGDPNVGSNQSSIGSPKEQDLLYCFCGKVLYGFLCQQRGKIVQVDLKKQQENTFKIGSQYLSAIHPQKNTDFLVLLYVNSIFEIRNTQTLDVVIKLVLPSLPEIEVLLIQNSIIMLRFYSNILLYCQVRPSKIHQLYILNGKSCQIYSKLLILKQKTNRFKLYFNLSKPKLLRQVNLIFKNNSNFKFIEKEGSIFLKEKFLNFAKFYYYKWWVGNFQHSDLIKKYFDGSITSREAKQKIYILEYKSTTNENQLEEVAVDFFSPNYPVYDRYGLT